MQLNSATRMFIAAAVLSIAGNAQAVLVYKSGSPPTETRTAAPSNSSFGTYNGAVIGDWVGQYHDVVNGTIDAGSQFSGTAIGPHTFVTAKHLGYKNTFVLGGTTYSVLNTTFDSANPNSDLLVGTINGTFSSYAPLYQTTDEVGKTSQIFGDGRLPGALVTSVVNGNTINNGYKIDSAAPLDGVLSLASDVVDQAPGSAAGSTLRWTFDPTNGSSSLTEADSGGAVFLLKNGVWYLGGVNFGITSPFSQNSDGSNPFNATIFEAMGLYYNVAASGQPANWQPVTGPGFSSATRIAPQYTYLSQFVPEPAVLSLLAVGGLLALRRKRQ